MQYYRKRKYKDDDYLKENKSVEDRHRELLEAEMKNAVEIGKLISEAREVVSDIKEITKIFRYEIVPQFIH